MVAPSRPFWLVLGTLLGMGCVESSKSPVRLNEILPSNSDGCADEIGERNDWVEIYNTSNEAVDLAGYSLTDDTASPRKSVIPKGITIEAKRAQLFWADGAPVPDKNHLTFKLKSKTEEVVLYDPEERQVDLYRWTDAYSDISFARVPDGTGDWVRCAETTCGDDNSSACGS
jgi:Lamin Tail Domain